MFNINIFAGFGDLFFFILLVLFLASGLFYVFTYKKDIFTKKNMQILLLCTGLLIVIILSIRVFQDKPEGFDLYALFKDTGSLKEGSKVMYRGLSIGEVYDITITEDSMFAKVHFIITEDNVNLLKGSYVELSFRSITDSQALIIKPPAKANKVAFIEEEGVYLEAKESVTIEETQKLIAKMIEEGKVEAMINDLAEIVNNSSQMTKDFSTLLNHTSELVKSVQRTNENVNEVINNQNITENLEKTVKSARTAVNKFGEVANKAENLVDTSETVVKNIDCTVARVNQSLYEDGIVGNLTTSSEVLTSVLGDIKGLTGDENSKVLLKEALKDTSETLNNLNCVTEGIGSILSKRFLIPRLIIGKPGGAINECFRKEAAETAPCPEESDLEQEK